MRQNFAYESISIGISSAVCASGADDYSDLSDAAKLRSTLKKLDNTRLKQRLVNRTE
jgi:hypothetical protein